MFGNWFKTSLLMAAIMALFGVVGAMLGGAQGMLLALGFGLATNLWAYWFSDSMVLRLYNAREVDTTSAPQLYALVQDLAGRAGLPMPRLYLIDEAQPNAFAVPGGNVYVTDSLMKFVQNREELAGVLCHETSHDIHHDVLHLYQKAQRTGTTYSILDVLANVATGGRASRAVDTLASVGFSLQTATFSRDVESAADKKGAETCAQAGSNPWGMVWLFQQFEKADTGGHMEMLSDHPTDQHRIDDLKRDFAANPTLFARYSSSTAYGTPLGQSPRATTASAARATAYRPATKKSKGMFPPGSGYKY